jgi:hypothetical protein
MNNEWGWGEKGDGSLLNGKLHFLPADKQII